MKKPVSNFCGKVVTNQFLFNTDLLLIDFDVSFINFYHLNTKSALNKDTVDH